MADGRTPTGARVQAVVPERDMPGSGTAVAVADGELVTNVCRLRLPVATIDGGRPNSDRRPRASGRARTRHAGVRHSRGRCGRRTRNECVPAETADRDDRWRTAELRPTPARKQSCPNATCRGQAQPWPLRTADSERMC